MRIKAASDMPIQLEIAQEKTVERMPLELLRLEGLF
jgi:hypothetical protein